jgi:tight adherence protein C
MYEIWLIVAMIAAFGGVILFGFYLSTLQADRQRAVKLLESQVGIGGSESGANLREQVMSENFGKRVLVPVLAAAGRIARRITPLDTRDRIAKKIVLAGSPAGWDAERILALKVVGAFAGFVLGVLVSSAANLGGFYRIVFGALFTFVGFIFPDARLSSKVEDRQNEILRSLSDTLDLLTISVEAGLSLNAAIAQVVQNVPGVLSQEFARMLQEIQLGVSRSDAFKHLAERTDVEELNAFALAMIQADVFGVSIASVLRTQAQQLRIKRRQRAESRAQQTPVKIVFPLILCIMPSLFVVIIGPGVIRIIDALFHKS